MVCGIGQLNRRAAATLTHYTRMACESSKTFDDLTGICAQKDSARVTSNLLEGLKTLPVESNHRVFLVSHPGKIQYYVCFQCKGKFFAPRDFIWVKDIPWASTVFLRPKGFTRKGGRMIFVLSCISHLLVCLFSALSPPGVHINNNKD